MVNRLVLFLDRRDAGCRLAEVLGPFASDEPLVVALPRGGVPVGFEIAKALGAPLDILLVRKLGAPLNPEYGVGAIAEGGVCFIRRSEAELIGMSDRDLDAVVARELAELERRQQLYRGEKEPYPVKGRTVLLVDDGIATGGTAVVAAHALKHLGAAEVVLAVPVAPPGAEERLTDVFDEIVCLEHPHDFFGIGQFYADFRQVGDGEVIRLLREAGEGAAQPAIEIEPAPGARLAGDLRLPEPAAGLVVFAHGSGSGRLSPRNRQVAEALNEAGFATLLFDLLTSEEELDRAKAFDIALLSERLLAVTHWAQGEARLQRLPICYFGASTGAAAALRAAARIGGEIRAVVSRGGRPDLAAESLEGVVAPTLLIVGGADRQVQELNEQAAGLLRCEHDVAIVPGATHLFEEPGALERVADLAADWFSTHLPGID